MSEFPFIYVCICVYEWWKLAADIATDTDTFTFRHIVLSVIQLFTIVAAFCSCHVLILSQLVSNN